MLNLRGFSIFSPGNPEAKEKSLTGKRKEKEEAYMIFSFDAESDGLWGPIFAIGARVMRNDGLCETYDSSNRQLRFAGVLDLGKVKIRNEWVRKNVVPAVARMNASRFDSYHELLKEFSKFYLYWRKREGVLIAAHMPYIVESKLLRDMREAGFIGEWDGPYPLYDVAGYLDMVDKDPTSVDKFAAELGIINEKEEKEKEHNPLYDSIVAGKVFAVVRNFKWRLKDPHIIEKIKETVILQREIENISYPFSPAAVGLGFRQGEKEDRARAALSKLEKELGFK